MYDAMEDPEHAVNKNGHTPTSGSEERRSAISNLRAMQALARPRMTRKVFTPWRGEEPESPDEPDIEMPDADLTHESGGNEADRRERRPTERLARSCAVCYVETPGYENRLALRMLMSWFDERTADWVAGECIRAGIAMSASEAGIPTALRASIPRRAHGPPERESLPAPQTSSPTIDIYRECATEGCTALVCCNGGDRQPSTPRAWGDPRRQPQGHLHRLFYFQEEEHVNDPRKLWGLSDTCLREKETSSHSSNKM
jgi:hypothetical protein